MLKIDYVDDIPATPQRKYQMIDNGDNTVSFVDVTTYTQEGDLFGATDMNATNDAVNDNTAAIADINTALDGKEDKVVRYKYEYNLSNPTNIQDIFDKIETERGGYVAYDVGDRITIDPNYDWTEDGARHEGEAYLLECVASSQESIYKNSKRLIIQTVIFRGAYLEKSFELSFHYRWDVESGFPSPVADFPNLVTYFKDYTGNDLSTNPKYIGDDTCRITFEPIKWN